jgi:DNA double-strand break repair helicase HerA and related ATPase
MAGMADTASRIARGYAFEGPALELGSVVTSDGEAHPDARVRIPLGMLTRHGLVAGATGTGKTKTLQGLAEQLSAAGVPVFLADVKGDLSGLSQPGTANDKIAKRAADTGDDWQPRACPVEFLAVGGEGTGVPVRATMTSFGPLLLSKVLGLNQTQESSLGLIFHFADTAGLPLLDLKDLRSVIQYLTSEEGRADLEGIGGLAKATAGVILRELVTLESQGADVFFGEPEFDTADLLRPGMVSCMELPGLATRPALLSTFLMWLLADLYHELPEVGDLDKPKLVFFFDEAHLLFADASKAFLDAAVQTVRLVRSKGVGVFFCTQSPADIPDAVLGQLGNRIQHALRAFTPDDATALRRAVRTYPKTSDYDLESTLTSLGTGEAIVTVLAESGAPTPVAWTRLRAPRSLMAQIPPETQQAAVDKSPLQAEYGRGIDRDSAYERLAAKLAPKPEAAHPEAAQPEAAQPEAREQHAPSGRGREQQVEEHSEEHSRVGDVVSGIAKNSAVRSFIRSAASALGREITRGMFGTARRRRR